MRDVEPVAPQVPTDPEVGGAEAEPELPRGRAGRVRQKVLRPHLRTLFR